MIFDAWPLAMLVLAARMVRTEGEGVRPQAF